MRKLSVILMLLVLMPCFPDAAIAQTVWHLNAVFGCQGRGYFNGNLFGRQAD